jgi:hypothetical protein
MQNEYLISPFPTVFFKNKLFSKKSPLLYKNKTANLSQIGVIFVATASVFSAVNHL